MWVYEKKLQYPVRVSKCDPRMAKLLLEQYGGADGELAAALRYLNQRYSIPDKVIGLLTDIGTEEFAHLEMIATMVYKLTKDATPQELEAAGLGAHYVSHDSALFYENAGGVPWTAAYIQAKGEPIVYLDTTVPCDTDGLAIFNIYLCNQRTNGVFCFDTINPCYVSQKVIGSIYNVLCTWFISF